MKKCVYILGLLVAVVSCSKPVPQIQLPTVIWVDSLNQTDTIITKYSHELNTVDAYVYYARLNWQTDVSPTTVSGTKMITIYDGDSVYLSRNDNTNNYDGPYQFKFSSDGLKLTSQDLLNPPGNSSGRAYVRLQ